ncbi:MAG: ParB/RepB/Spo0J family partition protein [Alphaproteobacteria bacterium]|jgi:ParB family chromosome partitioning protein
MPADESRKRGLGRGLSSLLGDETEGYASLDRLRLSKTVPIELLRPGQFQPRRVFDPEALETLAQSIREQGVLQPLLVRRDPEQVNAYEIVAGERRWRAAQKAQLTEIPVVIKELDDSTALAIAVVENIQREDLTPIEEATAYQRLTKEFSYTQDALAQAVGKSRSHIANMMRLLALPQGVMQMIDDGQLSAGHARALVVAENPDALAHEIVRRGLNVRQAEQLVKTEKPKNATSPKAVAALKDPNIASLEDDLSNLLGLRVVFKARGDSGSMVIHYNSLEQLDNVLDRLTQGAAVS